MPQRQHRGEAGQPVRARQPLAYTTILHCLANEIYLELLG